LEKSLIRLFSQGRFVYIAILKEQLSERTMLKYLTCSSGLLSSENCSLVEARLFQSVPIDYNNFSGIVVKDLHRPSEESTIKTRSSAWISINACNLKWSKLNS